MSEAPGRQFAGLNKRLNNPLGCWPPTGVFRALQPRAAHPRRFAHTSHSSTAWRSDPIGSRVGMNSCPT